MAQAGGLRLGGERLKPLGHAVQTKFLELVEGRVGQHGLVLLVVNQWKYSEPRRFSWVITGAASLADAAERSSFLVMIEAIFW